MNAVEGTLEHWAQCAPDRLAVIDGDRSLTYGDWNDQADALAEGLAAMGIGAGDRIGIRSRIRLEWFIVQRALGKLGVEGVAVNWRLTAPEAQYILADCGARGIICDDEQPSTWNDLGIELVVSMGRPDVDGVTRAEDLIEGSEPVRRYGPVRPPLVLYTSGTTGKPKGVPPLDLERADLAKVDRYYRSVLSRPGLPDEPRTLLTLPVHHGAGPFAAAATCQRGGLVVTHDPFDAEGALALIERYRINAWTAVPTMLLRMKALGAEVLDRYDASSIEVLTVGAAAVPFALKEWAVERFGEGVLWEGYGCSEAGMITGTSPAEQLTRVGTSGRPFDEVELRIVDPEWNDVPTGESGEIAVATPVMVDHYLGRERMDDDTLRDGFYRTGDVGRVDEDGYLYITDRVKDMIVAGGSNIYPAEVEAALVEHPDVTDCAVIGIPHDEFGEEVMAFVVPRDGAAPTLTELQNFLSTRLARYKMPRALELVPELPLSPMGKVTKTVLRDRFWADRGRNV